MATNFQKNVAINSVKEIGVLKEDIYFYEIIKTENCF